MSKPENLAALLNLLESIAQAIRRELGEEIDAYPGCRSPEGADPLNQAFRAVVRSRLEADLPPTGNTHSLVSQALRQLAEGRLAAEGWDDGQVKFLIEDEPGGPDDWLAFLILSSRQQIEILLDPDR
jgi:hypothetical protein